MLPARAAYAGVPPPVLASMPPAGTAVVRGRLAGADGRALAGADVRVLHLEPYVDIKTGARSTHPYLEARTFGQADGRFAVEGLRAGRKSLMARCRRDEGGTQAWHLVTASIVLSRGAEQDLGTLAPRGEPVEIVLAPRERDGAALDPRALFPATPEATVALVLRSEPVDDDEAGYDSARLYEQLELPLDGRVVRVHGLWWPRYVLRADLADLPPLAERFELDERGAPELRFDPAARELCVPLVLRDLERDPPTVLVVRGEGPLDWPPATVHGALAGGGAARELSVGMVGGRFRLELRELEPGEHLLFLTHGGDAQRPGGLWGRARVVLAERGRQELTVTLLPGVRVEGRLELPERRSLAFTPPELAPLDLWLHRVRGEPDGRFGFGGVAPSSELVHAQSAARVPVGPDGALDVVIDAGGR